MSEAVRAAAAEGWRPWVVAALPRVAPAAAVNARAPMPAAAAPKVQPSGPDPAELARLRQQAREAGAAQGRQEGLEQGRKEGFAEGRAEGLQAAQVQLRQQAGQLAALAQALPAALAGAERIVSAELAALAIDIARQVVHRSLAADPGLITAVVQDLLRQQHALCEPQLLLHPADLKLVDEAVGDELRASGWQLRSDETIRRGGCMVQSTTGSLDATLETRLQRVAAAFLGAQREGQ